MPRYLPHVAPKCLCVGICWREPGWESPIWRKSAVPVLFLKWPLRNTTTGRNRRTITFAALHPALLSGSIWCRNIVVLASDADTTFFPPPSPPSPTSMPWRWSWGCIESPSAISYSWLYLILKLIIEINQFFSVSMGSSHSPMFVTISVLLFLPQTFSWPSRHRTCHLY